MTENKNAKTPTDDGQPVAWITNGGKGELWWYQSSKFDEEGNLIGPNPDDIPLYTAPRDSDNTAQRTVDKIKGREMTTMDDAIAAGDGVLMNEQAALLRECRMALDHLLRDKPMLAAKVCGTTTLGNLRAMLHEYRPQGVFGGMK